MSNKEFYKMRIKENEIYLLDERFFETEEIK